MYYFHRSAGETVGYSPGSEIISQGYRSGTPFVSTNSAGLALDYRNMTQAISAREAVGGRTLSFRLGMS